MEKLIDVQLWFNDEQSEKAEEVLTEFLTLLQQNDGPYSVLKVRVEEGTNVVTFYPRT